MTGRPESVVPVQSRDHALRVELFVSGLLRTGVLLSLLMVVAGTALTLLHHPDYLVSRQALARLTQPGAEFPSTVGQTWEGLLAGHGRGLTVAGLLLLIFTPVARVATSIVVFALERDWRFFAMTTAVLLLLLGSFLLGAAH
jgi:uncharacterized membrane protein